VQGKSHYFLNNKIRCKFNVFAASTDVSYIKIVFSQRSGLTGRVDNKGNEAILFIPIYMTSGMSVKEAFVLGELSQEINS
jgi:hypothetical protein